MNVLVVDDQRSARHVLSKILSGIDGVEVTQAGSLDEARAKLHAVSFDVAFIDLRLGDDIRNRDGLVLIKDIAAGTGITPVVVSGFADVGEFRAAFHAGAHDYLVKDSLCDELVRPLLEAVRTRRRLEAELVGLRARCAGISIPTSIVGASPATEQLRAAIRRVSTSDRPVLVIGPTGSGKELVVNAIHALGSRPDAPLLDLNCSALPSALLESQLFGHEKGAFTGADHRHLGYLSAVGHGTLFLDEIAELESALQPKLLRVLEGGRFRAVGAIEEQAFTGRVLAATHVDLARRVEEGRFREDLFYRLNVLTVRVPSLDERREDIPLLVAHFASKLPRSVVFTDAAMAFLVARSWPGNIRQLRNLIDRVSVMCDRDAIDVDDIRAALDPTGPPAVDAIKQLARAALVTGDGDKLELVCRALVDQALAQSGANKSGAARLLGVHRKVVERWVNATASVEPDTDR